MASALVRPSAHVLNTTIGTRFITLTFNLILEGFVTAQAWHYFTRFVNTDEPKTMLAYAGVLFFATMLQSIFLFILLYDIHVLHFMDINYLSAIPTTYSVGIYLFTLITSLCQGFFAWRCYKLMNRPKWLAVTLATLIAVVLAAGMNIATVILKNPDFKLLQGRYIDTSMALWLGTACFTEIVISSLLIYRFNDLNREIQFTGTKNIVVRYLTMTMTTCVLATMFMMLAVILYFALPHTSFFVFGIEPFPKIYTCSVFVQLNCRKALEVSTIRSHHTGSRSRGSISGHVAIPVIRSIEQQIDELALDDMPRKGSQNEKEPIPSAFAVRSEPHIRLDV